MRTDTHDRAWPRLTVVAVLVMVALGFGAGSAGAQDPYGGTTTTAPGSSTPAEPTCSVNVVSAVPGTRVSGTVTGVPPGELVRVLFGGIEVARVVAPPAGQTSGKATGKAGEVSVAVSFIVPEMAPGPYLVTAVGGTFTCPCSPTGGFEVLAAKTSRSPVADGRGGGSLPRTGVYLGLLLAVALVLLLAGRAALSEARRRRRRATRRANRPLVVPSTSAH